MEELLKLQQEFAAVQKQDTTGRLSERNCVEIVLKLGQLGKIDVSSLHPLCAWSYCAAHYYD